MEDTPELSAVTEKLLHAHHVPGLSMAVIREQRLAHSVTVGLANNETRQPITESSVFQTASLTKPVVACVALQLCEANVIELDQPLANYLDHPYINDPRIAVITMRDVLRHTPGFPNWRPRGRPLRLKFRPGTRFSYSGEGYCYLQRVLEATTDEPLEAIVAQHVLEPLKLRHMGMVWNERFAPALAHPHGARGNVIEHHSFEEANAAYTLYSTPLDYAAFVIQLLDAYAGVDTDVLKQETAAIMLAPQVAVNPLCSWGLGWGIDTSQPDSVIWHWGDNSGYKNLVAVSLATRDGVVVMTNGDRGLHPALELAEYVLGRRLSGIRRFLVEFYGRVTRWH